MRRAILLLLLSLAMTSFVASPALACLQHIGSQTEEREFRSNYLDPPAVPSSDDSAPSGYVTQVVTISSLSGLLLLGGFVIGLGKRRG